MFFSCCSFFKKKRVLARHAPTLDKPRLQLFRFAAPQFFTRHLFPFALPPTFLFPAVQTNPEQQVIRIKIPTSINSLVMQRVHWVFLYHLYPQTKTMIGNYGI